MMIPPLKQQQAMRQAEDHEALTISIRGAHLIVPKEIVQQIFRDALNVDMVYYPERHSLLISAPENKIFTQLHKTKKHMLKGRSSDGDKTIALHEFLIDHNIIGEDRTLAYKIEEHLGILNIQL